MGDEIRWTMGEQHLYRKVVATVTELLKKHVVPVPAPVDQEARNLARHAAVEVEALSGKLDAAKQEGSLALASAMAEFTEAVSSVPTKDDVIAAETRVSETVVVASSRIASLVTAHNRERTTREKAIGKLEDTIEGQAKEVAALHLDIDRANALHELAASEIELVGGVTRAASESLARLDSASVLTLKDESRVISGSVQLIPGPGVFFDELSRPGKMILNVALRGYSGAVAVSQPGGGGSASIAYQPQTDADKYWADTDLVAGETIIGVRTSPATVRLPHDLSVNKIVTVKDETGDGNITVLSY